MHEVDIVLERDDGMIAGIEVKAAATVKFGNFAGLRTLAEACKERFSYGVVLYDSTDLVPFGDRLAAAPLSAASFEPRQIARLRTVCPASASLRTSRVSRVAVNGVMARL
jgi:hypothetical protein